MNIYQRLEQDHKKQKQMAEQLVDTTGDSAERQQLFADFKSEVEAHANAEEQTFYAVLIETPEGQEKARHSISEHKEAADLIAELSDLDMSNSAWLQKFKQLKDDLEHHIDEEEQEVFVKAKGLIEDQKAAALTEDFNQRKQAEQA